MIEALVPPTGRLEPTAIGVSQDPVIGMASAAPGVSVGLTLAALAAATAYAGGLVIVITAIPMLIIATAYRRLNLWSANCGASFDWVGRSISPYLGFLTGWLMIAAYITGAVSGVEVIGPNVLAVVTTHHPNGPWADIGIATLITLAMMVIAIAGIRLTARSQVPTPAVAYAIAGAGWARVMAFAVALSVIAATGTSIVLTARIIFGMASWRALPGRLATVSSKFATPVSASVLTGVLVIALTWVYLLATSI